MSEIEALAEAIVGLARPLLIAMDVDGTLAPIVDDPASARVPAETASTLNAIAGADGVSVALVSGRDAAQLARMVSLPAAWRVVEHGRSVLAPGEDAPRVDEAARAKLARFRAWAEANAAPRGARVEEKASSVVVHVRELIERDAAASDALLREARDAATREGLFPREGRAVLEAQTVEVDKGSALAALMARVGAAACVYAGDDKTDEPAIRTASAKGIGLFVRSSERPEVPEGARGVLDGPDEVALLLARVADRL